MPSDDKGVEGIATYSQRLVIDIQTPGQVAVAVLNTSDDAVGEYWVVWECDPDTADKVAQAIITKAAEARTQ